MTRPGAMSTPGSGPRSATSRCGARCRAEARGPAAMGAQYAFRASPDQQAGRAAHHRVIIVGAGPVGLSLALDLNSRGIEAVVLEAGTAVGTGSRAICYAKRSL